MKNRISLLKILILFLLSSCSRIEDYKKDLASSDLVKIDDACFQLGEAKDTSSVKLLLTNINDPRVTHDIRYKGMSCYQCRIAALRKISDLTYENKITYKVDTGAINFYLDWAISKGYLKSRTDVQLEN